MWKKTMWLFRMLSIFDHRELGMTLIETLVALTILGTISITFLSGLATTSKAVFMADQQTTAESLVRSQMEWVKNTDYVYDATQYSPAPMPSSKDYINYSVVITAEPLYNPDTGIQTITVTIRYSDEALIKVKGYKVDR